MNKDNIKKLMSIVAFGVVLYLALDRFDLVISGYQYIIRVFWPLLMGGCIAFVLGVPLKSIEGFLFGKVIKSQNKLVKSIKRPLSIVVTLFIVGSVLFMVFFLVVPQLGETVLIIMDSVPAFIADMEETVNELTLSLNAMNEYFATLAVDWDSIGKTVVNFMGKLSSTIISSTLVIASTVVGQIVQFFIALIFAVYILMQKERLSRQAKQIIFAYIPKNIASEIVRIFALANRLFSKFLSGQCTEAVILGLMFFIVMLLFKLPYAMLVSVLISVTALVPIVGSFIGCTVGAFLILIVSPIQALTFVILFLVLQQVEGNLIYPYVVGGSIGLPSIWVLAAVTVGGAMFGVAGMLLFIPLCSVLYVLLKENVHLQLEKKDIGEELYNPDINSGQE